jgi:filamentous hemagglutinin
MALRLRAGEFKNVRHAFMATTPGAGGTQPGALRPGVLLKPGETLAPGLGHAEADIVNFTQQNGLRLLEVGATRPICPSCAAAIEGAGAVPVTPLKVP